MFPAIRLRPHKKSALPGSGTASADGYSLEWAERSIDYQFGELTSMARSVATLGELTPRSQDAIVSFGERLSSLLVAAAFQRRGIPVELVDSRQFVITDSHFTAAAPEMRATQRRTRELLVPVLESGCVPVAQGFIGSTAEGVTTTIGRGGSERPSGARAVLDHEGLADLLRHLIEHDARDGVAGVARAHRADGEDRAVGPILRVRGRR